MSLRTSLKKNAYMAGHFLSYALTPRWIYRRRLQHLLNDLTDEEKQLVAARVDYYNRLTQPTAISNTFTVGGFRFPYSQKRRFTFYFFDMHEVVRYFPKQLRFCFLPGDVTHVPDCPTFVKSRPIQGNNSNSVILKLNKRRHFGWLVKNDKPFSEKKKHDGGSFHLGSSIASAQKTLCRLLESSYVRRGQNSNGTKRRHAANSKAFPQRGSTVGL